MPFGVYISRIEVYAHRHMSVRGATVGYTSSCNPWNSVNLKKRLPEQFSRPQELLLHIFSALLSAYQFVPDNNNAGKLKEDKIVGGLFSEPVPIG